MIKAGIIGATGYAGNELVRILVNHPEAEIVWLGSKSYEGQPYSDIFKNMRGITDDICLGDDFEKLSEMADVIFTATPQGYLQGLFAGGMAEKILSSTFGIASYSTIPSVDLEIGDTASDISGGTLKNAAEGITEGLDHFFGSK